MLSESPLSHPWLPRLCWGRQINRARDHTLIGRKSSGTGLVFRSPLKTCVVGKGSNFEVGLPFRMPVAQGASTLASRLRKKVAFESRECVTLKLPDWINQFPATDRLVDLGKGGHIFGRIAI